MNKIADKYDKLYQSLQSGQTLHEEACVWDEFGHTQAVNQFAIIYSLYRNIICL